MSFQLIRGYIEEKVFTTYQNMVPPIEVMFDNVQETPPALPYVICLISYLDVTTPVICQNESMVENINGNLQLSVYAHRGRGMSALENYASEGMRIMNTMYDANGIVRIKCGQISGPVPLLNGSEPYAVVTLSCPFVARVVGDGPDGLIKMFTDEVSLQ